MGWPDKLTGYVEVKGGPKCGNCKYLGPSNECELPVVAKTVSPYDGCCSFWDDGSGQDGITPPPAQTPGQTLQGMMGR